MHNRSGAVRGYHFAFHFGDITVQNLQCFEVLADISQVGNGGELVGVDDSSRGQEVIHNEQLVREEVDPK